MPTQTRLFHPPAHYQSLKSRGEQCYELRSLESDNRITLVLSNTRELDRVPSTK